jgi:hypothetical protein
VGGPETAWTEIIIIQLKIISTSFQRGHEKPAWDL